MNRRELLKKISLTGLVLIPGVSLLSSCKQNTDYKQEVSIKNLMNNIDREKLIVNREKMTIKDPDNPTNFELKHTPEISFDKITNEFTPVKIVVGSNGIIHPTTEKHWIDFMKIYVNNRLEIYTEYNNGITQANSIHYIKLKNGDKVKVEIGCNLHGIWSNETKYQSI